jgi:Holliday junction resolvasome RuvABC ATP-dependent DNA helicase subunit
MYFIGQSRIMNELSVLLKQLYSSRSGTNILIRGPSGWGKTRMALGICNYLSGRDFYMAVGSYARNDKWVQFIDECHLINDPEFMYEVMDMKKYVMIFCTNDASILKEAFVNRCTYSFYMEPYTDEELFEMVGRSLRIRLLPESIKYLIDSGGGNPRLILGLASRINTLHDGGVIESLSHEDFVNILDKFMGIRYSLSPACTRYLSVLRDIGGTASLDTMASMLRMDKSTIRSEIEPVLLYKNLITISSKGRKIKNDNYTD